MSVLKKLGVMENKLFSMESSILKEHKIMRKEDFLEKEFIMSFLSKIPIEYLKKLVSFNEIDFENKELYKDEKSIQFLTHLKERDVVLFQAKLKI